MRLVLFFLMSSLFNILPQVKESPKGSDVIYDRIIAEYLDKV